MIEEGWMLWIISLACLQFLLIIVALWDLLSRREVRRLPKLVWVVVIVVLNFIGPISYLVLGRGRKE